MLDWFHKFILDLDAAKTWFDFSAAGSLHYKECKGNLLLNWKNKGYKSFLDLQLVSLIKKNCDVCNCCYL